jgi:hypothetical protein
MARIADESRLLVALLEHDPERYGPLLRALLDRVETTVSAARTVLGVELAAVRQ